jgi:monovalent cation/hydrogen antiporter
VKVAAMGGYPDYDEESMFESREGARMHNIEVVILLLAVAVFLGFVANWLKLPYPILLVLGGLLLSFQPWMPQFLLPPEVVFLAFLPPLLYAAAFNTSWVAFRTQLRAITLLAVGLVVFTTVMVAFTAKLLIPELSWACAFILGAIISPPDAVAATSITKFIRVPRIVVTILEGESLVNDATALVAYRIAIAAAVGTIGDQIDLGMILVQFLSVGLGGILVGVFGAFLIINLHRLLNHYGFTDNKLTILMTLLTPYAVYLPAEHLHVSGVLAAVAAGLWVGHRCESIFSQELYVEARAVWEMMEFLLNALIFILIGFQLPNVLEKLNDYPFSQLILWPILISLVVIVARIVWVFPGAYIPRWFDRQLFSTYDPYPAWQAVAVVSWTGMRGVVSLAAALAIPETVKHRDLIQYLTFWVIFATLVGQGLTLPVLIRLLGVSKLAHQEPPEEPTSC